MHQQIRIVRRTTGTQGTPALAPLLKALADAKVDIRAIGGTDLEVGLGGEIFLAVRHTHETRALTALTDYLGFQPDLLNEGLDFRQCPVTDVEGGLLECIDAQSTVNARDGRVIKDVLIGLDPEDGIYYAQIYSVDAPTGD